MSKNVKTCSYSYSRKLRHTKKCCNHNCNNKKCCNARCKCNMKRHNKKCYTKRSKNMKGG